jgi:hypothetical protein
MTEPSHIITLEYWEYEIASLVAARRVTANWGKHDAAWYDAKRMEDNRTALLAGTVAEMAVAKALNRYWSPSAWNPGDHDKYRYSHADVGVNIEVRRVRKRDGRAAVRKHQVGKKLVLFVAYPEPPEFTTVEILGWLPYDDAWEVGAPAEYDRTGNTRTVAASDLILWPDERNVSLRSPSPD